MNNEPNLSAEAMSTQLELHRSILRAAMDGFWLMDLEGQLLEVNAAYSRMSGYSEPELLAMNISDLSVIESREQAVAHIAKIMERGQDRFETRHRRKDGSIIDIEVSTQYQAIEGGRIIVFLRDITERRQAEEALKESDAFIRSVMDNLPIGIAVNTVDPGVFRYLNENFCKFYRTTREALIFPDAFWSAVYEDPEFREEMRKRVLEDCASGDPERMHWTDVPITRNGEETHYIEARNTLLPDKQLMVSTVWDVTARKQAELALLQEQELYEDLVNTLPAGAYRLRVKSRGSWQAETWQTMAKTQYSLDFASDRFCAILGIAREALAANPGVVSDFLHPDDKEDFDAKNAQAMTAFNPFIWEGRIINNKQIRWVHFESLPRAIDPETVLWTGIVYDITDLKQAEETLRENEERMCLAMQAGNMGIYDLNVKTGVAVVNPEYLQMLGYDPTDLQVTVAQWIEQLHPDDREPVAARYQGYVNGELPDYNVEFRQRTRDGGWKWILSYGRIMERDPDGVPRRMLGVHVDISDRKQAEVSLRQAEQKLRYIVEHSTNLFYMHTTDQVLTYVSPQAWQFFDCAPDDVMVRWTELLTDSPLNRAAVESTQRAIDTGERQPPYNLECIGRKGRKIWVEVNEAPIVENGRTVSIVGSLTDITERMNAEEKLLASRNLLRSILENVPIRVFWKDTELRYLGCNTAFAHDAGFSHPEELLDKDDFQMCWREQAELYRADDQRVIASGTPKIGIEEPQTTPDGRTICLRTSKVPLHDAGNTVVGVLGIYEDITQRKQVEESLRESENRLRFALEGSNDGLWDVQMQTGATYISPRSWEILGYQGDEAREYDNVWSDLVHPEDLLLTEERLRQHIEGVTPIFEVEQRLRTKSGGWKWVLARGKVVSRDEGGKPLRITGTHTDLTGQKILQEQLNQAQKMESVGRLAGGVAHDFNNMLCVILGHVEMARKKAAVSPKLLDHLEQIQHAAERSADIVRQLLAFARKQTITPRILNLKESVASMLKILRRLIGEEISLLWHSDEAIWPVKMDPSQMDQILVNLCVNARDAIAGVGRIIIETSNVSVPADFCAGQIGLISGDYVLLTVSDNGCGMDKETSKKIFEPFFTTKEEGQGTGLGLAMVYGIVKQNAGFIAVDSEPGQGTSFKIYLPRFAGKEEQAQVMDSREPVRQGEETVLLVEDEPAILELCKEILEMQGYHVLAAGTPGEAIRIAEEHRGDIHLLITDVVMPEMNGRELTSKLLSLYPGLKRLFMSGYTADVIAHHGVLDEGIPFIQKPFTLDALAAKAREVLGDKT